jgi:hypothetical protein
MGNSRRDMMAGACAAAAMTFAPAALAAWEPSQRYPDPAVQSLDPSFNKYRCTTPSPTSVSRKYGRWLRRNGLRNTASYTKKYPMSRPIDSPAP